MVFKSVNPKNGLLMKTYDTISNTKMMENLERSFNVFRYMKNQGYPGLQERMVKLDFLKKLMGERKQSLAEMVTNEMGKPIKESIAEVEKSMGMIDYYNANVESFMLDEIIPTKYKETKVVSQPWGPTLSKIP